MFRGQIAEFRAKAMTEMLKKQATFRAVLAADHESFQIDTFAKLRRLQRSWFYHERLALPIWLPYVAMHATWLLSKQVFIDSYL